MDTFKMIQIFLARFANMDALLVQGVLQIVNNALLGIIKVIIKLALSALINVQSVANKEYVVSVHKGIFYNQVNVLDNVLQDTKIQKIDFADLAIIHVQLVWDLY